MGAAKSAELDRQHYSRKYNESSGLKKRIYSAKRSNAESSRDEAKKNADNYESERKAAEEKANKAMMPKKTTEKYVIIENSENNNSRKPISQMSDQELRSVIDRLRLEKELTNLINGSNNSNNSNNSGNTNNTNKSYDPTSFLPSNPDVLRTGREYVNDLNRDVGNYVRVGTDVVRLINNIYDTKQKFRKDKRAAEDLALDYAFDDIWDAIK